jgi:hypothetical protein
VFAPNQRWTLQGDFGLNTVNVLESPGGKGVIWVNGQTLDRASWYDYRHLDLRLPLSDSLTWTFYLPRTTRHAVFHTQVTVLTSAPAISQSRHISVFLSMQVGQSSKTLLAVRPLSVGEHDWQPIEVSLLPYAGQTVTLQLASSPASTPGSQNVDQLLFRYPYIDVLLDDDPATAEESQRVATVRPQPGEDDLAFSFDDTTHWQAHGLRRTDKRPTWLITSTDARLTYTQSLSECLADYSHLYVRAAVKPGIDPRVLQWFYQVDGAPVSERSPFVQLPLLRDGEMHEYAYPLRLIELDQTARLTGFTWKLQRLSLEAVGDELRIDDMRLLGQAAESHCR